MVSERKVYVDSLEQQSLLNCQASSNIWGGCTEYAKFSYYSSRLRKTVFLCSKHLTWILEEPEQLLSETHCGDCDVVRKKKTAFLEEDPPDLNKPCMAVHAAGRRRGRVCCHRNTFCFYSFLLKDYIYLCRRHFLWIDGQIGHEVSFQHVPNDERTDEECTSGSLNLLENLVSNTSSISLADVVLNTSPVTPTRRKENESTTDISDARLFFHDKDTYITAEDRYTSESQIEKMLQSDLDEKQSNESRAKIADMVGSAGVKSVESKETKLDNRLRSRDHICSNDTLLSHFRNDVDVMTSSSVVQSFAGDHFSAKEEEDCPVSTMQHFSEDGFRVEGVAKQFHDTLRKHVSGKLKSLQLKPESFSRLLLHRGRPRSPTIDEHSTGSLATHLHKEYMQGLGRNSNNKTSILSIPVTSEMEKASEQNGFENIIPEQSEESSAVSEKEDPSSLNIAARTVLDSHASDADTVTKKIPNVPHSMTGQDVTLTTQFSETKFSTTQETHTNETIPTSHTKPTGNLSLNGDPRSDSCCCTIC